MVTEDPSIDTGVLGLASMDLGLVTKNLDTGIGVFMPKH